MCPKQKIHCLSILVTSSVIFLMLHITAMHFLSFSCQVLLGSALYWPKACCTSAGLVLMEVPILLTAMVLRCQMSPHVPSHQTQHRVMGGLAPSMGAQQY